MIRILCSTDTCTTQAAQLGNLRRLLATTRYERDAAIAQAAALAEDNAKLRAELDAAREGAAFYMGLFCDAHAVAPEAAKMPQNRG